MERRHAPNRRRKKRKRSRKYSQELSALKVNFIGSVSVGGASLAAVLAVLEFLSFTPPSLSAPLLCVAWFPSFGSKEKSLRYRARQTCQT